MTKTYAESSKSQDYDPKDVVAYVSADYLDSAESLSIGCVVLNDGRVIEHSFQGGYSIDDIIREFPNAKVLREKKNRSNASAARELVFKRAKSVATEFSV